VTIDDDGPPVSALRSCAAGPCRRDECPRTPPPIFWIQFAGRPKGLSSFDLRGTPK